MGGCRNYKGGRGLENATFFGKKVATKKAGKAPAR